jgi:hypothetical protein
MAIDPRNYDLTELRAAGTGEPLPPGERRVTEPAASEADPTPDPKSEDETAEPDRPAAARAFESSIARDLATLDRKAGDLERP